MPQHPQYYDWTDGQPLEVSQACTLEEWKQRRKAARFAVHPSGFRVFLPPEALDGCDEYNENEPYTVGEVVGKWSPFHRRRLECTLELARKCLHSDSENTAILDLGCGKGYITEELRKAFPRAFVAGIDHSISAVQFAHHTFLNIDFIVADAYLAPYPPASFDLIVCNNLWEHVPDPLRLMVQVDRLLKSGGGVIISTPSRYRFCNLMRVVAGKPVKLMSEYHVTEYTIGQVLEQLRFIGYEARPYSRPIIHETRGILQFLAWRIVEPLLRCQLSMIGSHHSLEETVFFLGRKRAERSRDGI